MERRRRLKTEKNVVFDDDGNPKELRYYEDGKLSARLGVILDGDKNFIGLRELDVEEVSPPSWLDRLIRKREPTRLTIHTIDFIGLINWINTIKTIKTIESITNVGNIQSIDLIDEITKVGEISNIRDLMWSPSALIQNADFEHGFTGWIYHNATIVDDEYPSGFVGCHSLKFSSGGYVKQVFATPWKTDWLAGLDFIAYSPTSENLGVVLYFHDLTSDVQLIGMTGSWAKYSITLPAGKYVLMLAFSGDNTRIFAIEPRF